MSGKLCRIAWSRKNRTPECWFSLKASGRLEDTPIETRERHTGVTGLRHPVRVGNRLKHLPRFDGSDCQSMYRSLQAHLHILIVVERHQCTTLIAVSLLEFVGNVRHLAEESVEFGVFPSKQRLTLPPSDLREALDKISRGHIA